MVDRAEFVILRGDPNFKEPQNVQEAQARIVALKSEIPMLQALLKDKFVLEPGTDRRLKNAEYFDWKERTGKVLAHKIQEMALLRRWVGLKGIVASATPPQGGNGGRTFDLLKQCGQMLRRLQEEGANFTADELALISKVQTFTGFTSGGFLDNARTCMRGGSEQVFQYGGMIALTTRDDQDLAVLAEEWERVAAAEPRDQALVAKCAELYSKALAPLGRLDEALAITKTLDQNRRDTAYVWCQIAKHSGDAALQEYVRALARSMAVGQREWFFLRVYEMSGDLRDAQLALPRPENKADFGKRYDALRLLLLVEHVNWGKLTEAYELLSDLSPEEQMEGTACIAEASGEAGDLDRLVQSMSSYRPTKFKTVKRVAAALAQSDRGDLMVNALEALSSWHLSCGGYSVLARLMEDRALEMIDSAERILLTGKGQCTTSDESLVLCSLAYAQATNGRREAAFRTAKLIRDRGIRCVAFLMLHSVSRDESLPDFIADVLL